MGQKSTKEDKSVYQLAREELELSREKATDIISGIEYNGRIGRFNYLNYDKLVKLELGLQDFQPEDVLALSLAYNKPELRNYYCSRQCPIGEKDAPKVEDADNVHKILVGMSVSLESVNSKKVRLMEILEDGEVDSSEIKDLNKILDELEKISMTIEAIQLWCEKAKHNKFDK
ncbi:MAG: hypothetical protein IKU10_06450 [Clostridia bacterium]|nr:hypothetical protein [Clostridia bacterium]